MSLCPNCQIPLFFDFDGNPQVGDSLGDLPSAEAESVQSLEANFIDEDPIVEQGLSEELLFENSDFTERQSQIGEEVATHESQISDEIVTYGNQTDNSFGEEVQENLQDQAALNLENEVPEEFDLNAPLGTFEIGLTTELNSPNLELHDEAASAMGHLLYDIEIEGIDGSKLRNELYEELKDPRWGWIAIELMGTVNNGRLVLNDVNAVKASLLVNRLKALPLEIKWKQQV